MAASQARTDFALKSINMTEIQLNLLDTWAAAILQGRSAMHVENRQASSSCSSYCGNVYDEKVLEALAVRPD